MSRSTMDLEEKADVLLRFSRTKAVCRSRNAVTVFTTDRLERSLELGGAFMLLFPFPHRWELLLLRLLLDRCACTSLRFLSSPEIRASGITSARLPFPSYVTAFTQSPFRGCAARLRGSSSTDYYTHPDPGRVYSRITHYL